MKLDTHERLRLVPQAFVRVVIGVDEPRFPVIGNRCRIHGVAVVLRSNQATFASIQNAGLIMATMAILHFETVSARRKSEHLVAEADAEYWISCIHNAANI